MLGVILGLGAVSGVAYYAYNEGKKQYQQVKLPYDTPDFLVKVTTDKNGISQATINGNVVTNTPDQIDNLTRIAGNIQDDTASFNLFTNHNEAFYTEALDLSNTDFVALYNIFNKLNQATDKTTLTGQVSNQLAVPFTAWDSIQTTFVGRCHALNLP